MFVVALTELGRDLADEEGPIAAALGCAAYDVRSRAAGVLPRVLLQTSQEDDARRVHRFLLERGHGAILCDTRDVVPSARLVRLHRFVLEDDAILAGERGERLAYGDIGAIVVIGARVDVARVVRETDLVPRTNGPPSTVVAEHTRHEHLIDQAAYLFPRALHGANRAAPWLLHEKEAQYVSLGAAMRPTRHENFLATIARIRARAPSAIYDDRFVKQHLAPGTFVVVRGHDSAIAPLSDAQKDLAVHLLGVWLLSDRGGPYR